VFNMFRLSAHLETLFLQICLSHKTKKKFLS
jgi:hypothetical protein